MTQFILMAEDDPDVQLVARLGLKKAGYRVVVVSNGRELLEHLPDGRPDLVLLDWMMPEMDGPETCRRLKSDDATRDIPVIFMSANSHGSAGHTFAELGAAGNIVKPFDPFRLGDAIRQILERAGLQ